MDFDKKLTDLLKKDLRFVDKEGDLIKSEIVNSASSVNKELIGLLINDKEIRNTFFEKIEDYWVFNINKFIGYIQDKNVFSNSVTKFEVKIGLNIDGKYLDERGEVSLVWPFKDCVLKGGMTKEDQGRNEIFFNEILAKDEIDRLFDPKVLTNFKKYTVKGEKKVKDFNRDEKGTIKDNLIIKGNNLLALHTLKEEFTGKVKLIYIDPPYNTGGDSFKYNDDFNHSTWLTFMKNRLEVAKELLSEKGVIFVQIDYNEAHYVKILLDEIFGRDMFRNEIIWWKTRVTKNQSSSFGKVYDIIFFYSKTDKYNFNPPTLPYRKGYLETYYRFIDEKTGKKYAKITMTQAGQGPARKFGNKLLEPPKGKHWKWSQKKIEGAMKKGLIVFTSSGTPNYKKYVDEAPGMRPTDLWIDIVPLNPVAGERLGLDGQKPEQLLQRIIETTTEKGDFVLDFFVGSGSTGAVCHKLDRKYICIEQMDNQKEMMIKRIKGIIGIEKLKGKINQFDEAGISKAVNWKGGGEFIYCELLKYNEEAIDKIQEAKDIKQLLKIWGDMCEKYFLNYDVQIKKFNDNKKYFEKLSLKQQKEELIKMLNKNQLYVNFSEIEDSQYKISKEDKELNKKFYGDV